MSLPEGPTQRDDASFMGLALEEARKGEGRTGRLEGAASRSHRAAPGAQARACMAAAGRGAERRAPARSAELVTARRSTAVMPTGTAITIRGFTQARPPCTFVMK